MVKKSVINKPVIFGTIIILILLTVVIVFAYEKNDNEAEAVAIKTTDYDEIKEQLNKEVEEGKINVQYQLYNEFDGKESVDFLVRNNANNHFPIKFNIYDEDQRKIYVSPELELGYEINEIVLEKQLSRGEHDCQIEISYVSEGNVTSRFPLKINVL